MSMGPENGSAEMVGSLVHELRQSYGLGAAFFRAAAARIAMTDTDIQVIDLLERTGEATAGQLATLMGLTTGTFTAILNRLEKAGLIRRDRDPNDGRRVIVRLATGADGRQDLGPLFASLGQAWQAMAAHYDDAQQALLLEFLQRSNALARDEIARLRELPVDQAEPLSAPLGGLERAQLVFPSEASRLSVRAADLAGALYQVRFEGSVPDVKLKAGVVTIRYPRRRWISASEQRIVEVTLSNAIPWSIVIRSGGAEVTAELDGLDLLAMEANGAGSTFHVELPEPSGVVPIRLAGSGSVFTVRRPPGVAARVQSTGWGSGVVFDGQPVTGISSSEVRLHSPDYDGAARGYDIETSGSGSMMTVATR